MKINVHQDDLIPVFHEGEGESVSVFLKDLKGDGSELRNFRCTNCGRIVCQYEGKVAAVSQDGAVPKDKGYVGIMCHRCKTIYRFII